MTVSSANGAKALVVLVVEDEFFVRDDIATFLRDAGYVVVEGASGGEAIALCCKSAAMIDVVLTDINLWGLDEWVGCSGVLLHRAAGYSGSVHIRR